LRSVNAALVRYRYKAIAGKIARPALKEEFPERRFYERNNLNGERSQEPGKIRMNGD
jgi:hypothetical protein